MNLLKNIKKGQSNKPPRIMMIGVEGVGKSTAGAAMPNPIFICGEDGLVGNQFNDVNSFTPSSWEDVIAFCDELATEKTEFKSLVIDSLDWLEPMLYEFVCKKYGKGKVSHIEDFGFGKGYVLALTEISNLLIKFDKLNALGFTILVLAHSQIKTFQNPDGDNFDRYEPKVNVKVAGKVKEWCDAVLFARFDMYTSKDGGFGKAKAYGGQNRIVQTTHSAAWDAKNRFGLPDVMPLDMGEILAAIAQGQPNGKTEDEMVKELEDLITKMPKEQAEKTSAWLKKGGFTCQQLAQVINKARFSIKQNAAEN